MSYFNFNQPFSGVVRHLIIINALMYLGTYVILGEELFSSDGDGYAMLNRLKLAVFLPQSDYFQPYQVFTHMFMHGGIAHLAFNMMTLYFFGPPVEMVWGARRFLTYYLVCGLGSYVLYTLVQIWELGQAGISPADWNIPMLGASGAIFGVLVAFGFHFPNHTVSLLFPPISMKAKYFIPLMMLLELFYGVQRVTTGIAHYAHLGGALAGILLIGVWYKFRFK
jgi:membrane associated rhomboid family serine protease